MIASSVEVDAVLLQHPGRVPEARADQRVAVFTGPGAAVRLDEFDLAVVPIGLGVDEGAVHVPQDGGGKHSGHDARV